MWELVKTSLSETGVVHFIVDFKFVYCKTTKTTNQFSLAGYTRKSEQRRNKHPLLHKYSNEIATQIRKVSGSWKKGQLEIYCEG